jgi:hypothetical protein
MFAEPITKGKVNEQFQLICTDRHNNTTTVSYKDIGLQESSYQYTLRNIYYSNKTETFTQQLFISKCKNCVQLDLQRSTKGSDYKTLKSYPREP